MSDLTLAVVSNYRRPDGTTAVCQRLVDEPCDVIVADNGYYVDASYIDWHERWAEETTIEDIWHWARNSGPPARWFPALAWTHAYRYVMLVDDDHLPSVGIVSALVKQAGEMKDRFSVMGRIGRNFRRRRRGWEYRKRNVWSGQVDMAGAGYFLKADRLVEAVRFRDELAAAGADPRMLWHDDVILNCAVQRATGYPSVMPTQRWSERRLSTEGYAFSATDAYRSVRNELINLCEKIGWKQIERKG